MTQDEKTRRPEWKAVVSRAIVPGILGNKKYEIILRQPDGSEEIFQVDERAYKQAQIGSIVGVIDCDRDESCDSEVRPVYLFDDSSEIQSRIYS